MIQPFFRWSLLCLPLFVLSWFARPVEPSGDRLAAGFAAPPVTSLKLAGISPPAGATNVCIDTPLRLTFSAPPVLSRRGVIQILDDAGTVIDSIDVSSPTASNTIGGLPNFNYYPVIITGNEAIIVFKNNILTYGKTYDVKIPAGLFVDNEGNAASLDVTNSWRFSTKPAPPTLPAAGPRRITIAADGTGDFATLQGAIDFVPNDNTTPATLFLRKGTYNEIVYFSNKHNLTILGEDRKGSIIAYADNQILNNTDRNFMPGGYRRGVFRAVNSNDLVIANLTLHNTTPQGGLQAEAIILNGGANAHAVITDVDMYSYQDTLQINGQAYISNCYIEGDIDFMWGTGPCFFENCRLKSMRSNTIYTQVRNPATNNGYVYKNCTFEGAPGVTGNFLSGILPSRFPNSEVVLLDCTLTDAVSPVAWRLNMTTEAPQVHFWEYNSRDPEGKPVDDSKRLAESRRLTKEADADAIANYSNPACVLGNNWTPRLAPIITTQPAFMNGGVLIVGAAAVPPASFQWQRNGADIPGANATTYNTGGAPGKYSVIVSNPAGKMTSNPVAVPPSPANSVPATQHPALFLVGDSLMNTGRAGTGEVGPWGYGAELIPMFDPAKIHVYNEAKGGRSSRGYIEEGAWKNLLARMESGDCVLVQFGHNDAANSMNYPDRISGEGSGDEMFDVDAPGGKKSVHSYGWYLKQYVKDAAESSEDSTATCNGRRKPPM